MECGPPLSNGSRLLAVNKNNGNPAWSWLDSEPIRSVVVIRPNLIGHYLLGSYCVLFEVVSGVTLTLKQGKSRFLRMSDFLRNITIKKVKGNSQFENSSHRESRFDFDPRALKNRKAKEVGDLDLIGLNRASDGSSAILKFFPHSCAICPLVLLYDICCFIQWFFQCLVFFLT